MIQQLANQGISIFAMTSKSDYIDDADSFSTMAGLSGFQAVREALTITLTHFQIQKEITIPLIRLQTSLIQ